MGNNYVLDGVPVFTVEVGDAIICFLSVGRRVLSFKMSVCLGIGGQLVADGSHGRKGSAKQSSLECKFNPVTLSLQEDALQSLRPGQFTLKELLSSLSLPLYPSQCSSLLLTLPLSAAVQSVRSSTQPLPSGRSAF